MKELKQIILDHYHKYPHMKIIDFIKMFYQNTFGPLHMGRDRGLSQMIDFINDELSDAKSYPETNQIEAIGNDYYRVSLSVVLDGLMSVETLGTRFYQSIVNSPSIENENIDLFTRQIEMVRFLIQEGTIDGDLAHVDQVIDDYMFKGIRPVHHSEAYRKEYFPHYRVIHKKYLNEYLGV